METHTSNLENSMDRGAWWATVHRGLKESDSTEWLTLHWASLLAPLVKICLQIRRPQFDLWVRTIPWRRDRLPTPVFLGFPGGSDSRESACNVGNLGSIPGLEKSSGGGRGNLLQYSCLENPHGQRSLVGYSSWGHKESDMTVWLSTACYILSDIILSDIQYIYCIICILSDIIGHSTWFC